MNIPFAACLGADEYRRAVQSLRLDAHLLAVLSDLTGDPVYRTWAPAGVPLRVDTRLEVPRAVYEHAVICEYAHARLRGTSAPVSARVSGVSGRPGQSTGHHRRLPDSKPAEIGPHLV
jgi:hypothetical protein